METIGSTDRRLVWKSSARTLAWSQLSFALVLMLLGGAASAAPQFAIQDLGPKEATFISNDGRILGHEGLDSHWLWENGQRMLLNMKGGSFVNRNGYVAGSDLGGFYRTPFGEYFPYPRATLWHGGVLTDLGTLGGQGSSAISVNNFQVVVGFAHDPANVRQPFIWQNGVMSAIRVNYPAPGWTFELPLRITDGGRMFGTGEFMGSVRAVALSPAEDGAYGLIDLGAPDGTDASVDAFNDFGWATGRARNSKWEVEAFLLKDGKTTWLGNLGSRGSYGHGINNAGDVVGFSNSQAYRAFLWREGVLYNLNSCIPTNSGWVVVSANSINDAGQIVGHGILNGTGEINQDGIVNGGHRAFLMNPLPGTDQGLSIKLQGPAGTNQWLVKLPRQPTTNVAFEVSADLIHWLPIAHTSTESGFLIEGTGFDRGFFRVVFKP